MKKAFSVVAMLGALFSATAIGAEEGETAEEPKPLTGDVRFMFENTSGNTDTQNIGGEFNVKYLRDVWEYTGRISGSGQQDSDMTTEEKYGAEAKAKRFFGEKNYAYGELLYISDRFAGVTEQLSETVGYGRRVIDTETQGLDLEIGVGARQSEFSDGTKESGAIVQLGGDYHWQINDNVLFVQELNISSGSDNTYTLSITSLETQLVGQINLVVGYQFENNSKVPAGRANTDTKTTIGLAYKF